MMMWNVDWSLVFGGVKSLPTIALAVIVAWIAYQQWITAKNKLALDLFDRRYKTVQAINENLAILKKEGGRNLEEPKSIFTVSPPSRLALDKEIDQAKYLFGHEVSGRWRKLVGEVEHGRDAIYTALFKFEPGEEPKVNYMAVAMESRDRAYKLEQEINALVERYMMLDEISVNRPKKTKG